MDLYERFISLKHKEKAIKDEMLEVQCKLYEQHADILNSKDEGTINVPASGYKVKVTKKMTVSVDQEMADAIGIGFRKKYELDKKSYAKLNDDQKKSVDECLTTKPAKPAFSVERV